MTMTAKELREANKLWPQNLQASELEAEIAATDAFASPISMRMLLDERSRRACMTCYSYDKLAESFGIVVDSPGWYTLAAAAIGHSRPPGPRRTPSVRCASGKRNYCTCDTCF